MQQPKKHLFVRLAHLVIHPPPSFQVRNGHIKRITDNDIHSQVLEVEGTNVR